MQKAEAIIVLGRGINPDGSLPTDPQRRIEKAIQLLNDGRADCLVMSGGWSFHLMDSPPNSEARAMADYAISLGVSSEKILLEEESRDTMSNVYFVKTTILQPRNWKRIIVVTSEDHMERTQWDFHFVLGPDYSIEFQPSMLTLSGEDLELKRKKEKRSLWGTKKILQNVNPGDNEGVRRAIYDYIPGFADREAAVSKFKELMSEYDAEHN